ncbi:MAG TPA: translational repressor RegA [Coprothermobacter proteolyticus]|nr:translational repressor RegA [Coprothermobacter proteolyticus]
MTIASIALAQMIEIELPDPECFLKIKETLTRVGVSSETSKTLYPSCVILHKKGQYYIAHFKQMFLLEGKSANISAIDIARLHTIAQLLVSWGMCDFAKFGDLETAKENFNPKLVKIVPHREKDDWKIVMKFTPGVKKSFRQSDDDREELLLG